MRLGSHVSVKGERAKAACIAFMGEAWAATRRAEIAALPSKEWRGVRVYAITCQAGFGRGPHELWLPDAHGFPGEDGSAASA